MLVEASWNKGLGCWIVSAREISAWPSTACSARPFLQIKGRVWEGCNWADWSLLCGSGAHSCSLREWCWRSPGMMASFPMGGSRDTGFTSVPAFVSNTPPVKLWPSLTVHPKTDLLCFCFLTVARNNQSWQRCDFSYWPVSLPWKQGTGGPGELPSLRGQIGFRKHCVCCDQIFMTPN